MYYIILHITLDHMTTYYKVNSYTTVIGYITRWILLQYKYIL